MAALAALAAGSCQSTPEPYGEALVVVSTDASVPRHVARLRVDIFDEKGRWYDSRDVGAPTTYDWPVSFSIVNDDLARDKTMVVRLRAYPDGKLRDYHGIHFDPKPTWSEPLVHESLAELCTSAPLLALGASLTQRRGAHPITSVTPAIAANGQSDCMRPTLSGSVAARVTITQSGLYRFEVVSSTPDGSKGELGGDTTLSIRAVCGDVGSQVACNDDIDPSTGNRLSRVVVSLAPGSYFVVTGGGDPAPADVTLRADLADHWKDSSAPKSATVLPAEPRLIQNGADVTPAEEPQPFLAIDRLVTIRLHPGSRKTAPIQLRGECLGIEADVQGARSCVDRSGEYQPAVEVPLLDGIDRKASALPLGTWRATPVPCMTAPRRGSLLSMGVPAYDEQVCIGGGPFALGNALALQSGDFRSNQRIFVISPFLLDRYEYTVGRYRRALTAGFVPPDDGPTVNNAALSAMAGACTWNVGATPSVPAAGIDREGMPLTCVSWATARAICRNEFPGGDLPTEAEWEYAATAFGKSSESFYPWGDAAPDCNRVVFFRRPEAATCMPPYGPSAVGMSPWAAADATPAGVSGMGGNVQEWMLDSFAPYTHPLWLENGAFDPHAWEQNAPRRSVRGSDWSFGRTIAVTSSTRNARSPMTRADDLGFRCAHPTSPAAP